MSLFKSKEINVAGATKRLKAHLVPGEEVIKAYKTIRDMMVLTNRRVIILDKQGMAGKTEAYSIPYGSITHWSTEEAGVIDRDCDFKLWTKGGWKHEFGLARGSDLTALNEALLGHI